MPELGQPHDPPTAPSPPAPAWEHIGHGRGLGGCAASLTVAIFVNVLAFAATGIADAGELAGLLGVLVLTLACVLYLLPRVLTEQGIRTDADGVAFVQKPKWWFRGRSLSVPWNEIVSVGKILGTVSYYLRRTPCEESSPTWLIDVAEGADNPADRAYSPLARVHFAATDEQFGRLLGAARAWRPDLADADTPTRTPAMPAPGHQSHPRDEAYPQNPGHPQAPPHAPFEVQNTRMASWFLMGLGALTVVAFIGFVLAVLVGWPTGIPGSASTPAEITSLVVYGVIVVVSLIFFAFMIGHVPQYAAQQGIRVDAQGIQIFRKRQWWFDGDSGRVDWQDVHSLEPSTVKRGRRRRHNVLNIHLHKWDHELPLPFWAVLLEVNQRDESERAAPRLVLALNLTELGADRGGLLKYLRQTRPGHFHQQVAERESQEHEARKLRTHRDTGHRVTQEASGDRYEGSGNMSDTLFAPFFLAVVFGGVALVGLLNLLDGVRSIRDIPELPPDHALLLVTSGALALPTTATLMYLLARIPRYFAEQGLSADESGISVFRKRMWWLPGVRVHVGWHDIRYISMVRGHRRNRGRKSSRGITLIGLHLIRTDTRARLPLWTRLLLPGKRGWQFEAVGGPVVALDPDRISVPGEDVLAHIRELRPELFYERVAARAEREHEDSQQQTEQNGIPPRLSRASNIPRTRVNVRTRRAGRWVACAVTLLCLWTGLGIGVSIVFAGGNAPTNVEDYFPFLALSLLGAGLLALLTYWSALWLPRCFARQGIIVDGSGITLLREPCLWTKGGTARLPWTGIFMVREAQVKDSDYTVEYRVHVLMHHPDAVSAVPDWCELHPRAVRKPPADPGEPRTLIMVCLRAAQRTALIQAAQAARPDLVVEV